MIFRQTPKAHESTFTKANPSELKSNINRELPMLLHNIN